MNANEAAMILEALAKGIDPETGELFADESALNNPHVIRALFLGARALQDAPPVPGVGRRPPIEGPEQAGQPWTEEEERRLVAAYQRGDSIQAIADAHQRKTGGITSRLVKLGCIDKPEGKRTH